MGHGVTRAQTLIFPEFPVSSTSFLWEPSGPESMSPTVLSAKHAVRETVALRESQVPGGKAEWMLVGRGRTSRPPDLTSCGVCDTLVWTTVPILLCVGPLTGRHSLLLCGGSTYSPPSPLRLPSAHSGHAQVCSHISLTRKTVSKRTLLVSPPGQGHG